MQAADFLTVPVRIEQPPVVVRTMRVRQLEAMFDAAVVEGAPTLIEGEIPMPLDWSVGLVTGPSGSGKSTLMRHLWRGDVWTPDWLDDRSVVDSFALDGVDETMEAVTDALSAVGFNTIPAWMRPFRVLSTGEQFRAQMARHLLHNPGDPIVVDEFTSVVDRQVAKIASHAVQRYVRERGKRFVAVTVHEDVVPWLQPDWVIRMPEMRLERRSVQRRPRIDLVVGRVSYAAWARFAPYHYLTASLSRAAKCFGCWAKLEDADAEPRLAGFVGILYLPHKDTKNIWRISRQVTLPDWQGAGVATVLHDALGSAYKAVGLRLRHYPAHPPFIRHFDRSPRWKLTKRPGQYSPAKGGSSTFAGVLGGRPCAVFEYVGPAMDRARAEALLA